jgi:hypothetical protein
MRKKYPAIDPDNLNWEALDVDPSTIAIKASKGPSKLTLAHQRAQQQAVLYAWGQLKVAGYDPARSQPDTPELITARRAFVEAREALGMSDGLKLS